MYQNFTTQWTRPIILTLLSALPISASGQAASSSTPTKVYLYSKVHGGVANATHDIYTTSSLNNGQTLPIVKTYTAKTVPTGGLDIGLETQIDSFILGVEAGGQYLNAEQESKITDSRADQFFNVKVKTDTLWTAALKVGVRFNNADFYVLGGGAYTKRSVNVSTRPVHNAAPHLSSSSDKKLGWRFGLGASMPLWKECLSLGVEGNYYQFPKFRSKPDAPRAHPRTMEVGSKVWTLGVIVKYRFNLV